MPKLSDEWKEWKVLGESGNVIGTTKKLPFSPVVGGYVHAIVNPELSRKVRVDEVREASMEVVGTIIDRGY